MTLTTAHTSPTDNTVIVPPAPKASREPDISADRIVQPMQSPDIVCLFFNASSLFRTPHCFNLHTTMNQKYGDILRSCPYNLSRLAPQIGELEHVTGKELIGMLLLAKQRGRLCGFKDLWSCRRVMPCDSKVSTFAHIETHYLCIKRSCYVLKHILN